VVFCNLSQLYVLIIIWTEEKLKTSPPFIINSVDPGSSDSEEDDILQEVYKSSDKKDESEREEIHIS
jgi:hypothetical protein